MNPLLSLPSNYILTDIKYFELVAYVFHIFIFFYIFHAYLVIYVFHNFFASGASPQSVLYECCILVDGRAGPLRNSSHAIIYNYTVRLFPVGRCHCLLL